MAISGAHENKKTNFKNGKPHGKGVIQAPDGSLYTARWKDGKLKEKSIKPLEEK